MKILTHLERVRDDSLRDIARDLESLLPQHSIQVAQDYAPEPVHADDLDSICRQWLPDYISPRNIYCSRTGAIIGEHSDATLYQMAYAQSFFMAHCIVAKQVSPLWLNTSPANLDELLLIDPHGFLIYALSIVCKPGYKDYSAAKNEFKSSEARHQFHCDLIRARQLLQSVPLTTIQAANLVLNDYLTAFGADSTIRPMRDAMHTYISAERIADWTVILRNAVAQRCNQLAHYNYVKGNPRKFGNLIASVEKPASNFKGTKRSRKDRLSLTNQLMDSLGLDILLSESTMDEEVELLMMEVEEHNHKQKQAAAERKQQEHAAANGIVKLKLNIIPRAAK